MNDLLIMADEWSCHNWSLVGVSIIIRARCRLTGVPKRDRDTGTRWFRLVFDWTLTGANVICAFVGIRSAQQDEYASSDK